MRHQVVWARLNVYRGDRHEDVTVLTRGEYLPGDVDAFQQSTLLTIGAVKAVDEDLPPLVSSAVVAANTPLPPPETTWAGEPPARSAGKAAWVDYAVASGLSREEAEQLDKTALVERFGA